MLLNSVTLLQLKVIIEELTGQGHQVSDDAMEAFLDVLR